jgi:flagellar protein FlaG
MRVDALQPREMSGSSLATGRPAVTRPAVSQAVEAAIATGKKLPLPAAAVIDVAAAARLIDEFLRQAGRELTFSVDDITGRTVVSVRDPATGELIRQFPSEEALRIARNLEVHGAALVNELA